MITTITSSISKPDVGTTADSSSSSVISAAIRLDLLQARQMESLLRQRREARLRLMPIDDPEETQPLAPVVRHILDIPSGQNLYISRPGVVLLGRTRRGPDGKKVRRVVLLPNFNPARDWLVGLSQDPHLLEGGQRLGLLAGSFPTAKICQTALPSSCQKVQL